MKFVHSCEITSKRLKSYAAKSTLNFQFIIFHGEKCMLEFYGSAFGFRGVNYDLIEVIGHFAIGVSAVTGY